MCVAHLKPKSRCRQCNPNCKRGEQKKCKHGRREYDCKECGGKGICVHGERRTICIRCGGGSICEHREVRQNCKICKAVALCSSAAGS